MRIIFWGTPEYSIASLDIFIKSKHEVIGVVSQPDKKRSRGNKLISSPVKSIAEKESIKIYTPEKIRGNIDFVNELKSLSCDLFIEGLKESSAFGKSHKQAETNAARVLIERFMTLGEI